MTLNFSDGVSVDTSGKPRIQRLSDGIYVVGKGFMIPCDDAEEAQRIIKDMSSE